MRKLIASSSVSDEGDSISGENKGGYVSVDSGSMSIRDRGGLLIRLWLVMGLGLELRVVVIRFDLDEEVDPDSLAVLEEEEEEEEAEGVGKEAL